MNSLLLYCEAVPFGILISMKLCDMDGPAFMDPVNNQTAHGGMMNPIGTVDVYLKLFGPCFPFMLKNVGHSL